MRTCQHCGTPLTGKQTRWCSARCRLAVSNAARRARYLPDRKQQTTCLQCGGPIANPSLNRVYCSQRCCEQMRQRRRHGDVTAARTHRRITDQRVAEAKAQFPSCDREWTVDMVDRAVRKDMLLLIARKLERHDAKRSS